MTNISTNKYVVRSANNGIVASFHDKTHATQLVELTESLSKGTKRKFGGDGYGEWVVLDTVTNSYIYNWKGHPYRGKGLARAKARRMNSSYGNTTAGRYKVAQVQTTRKQIQVLDY